MKKEKKQFSLLFLILVVFLSTLPFFFSLQDIFTRILAFTGVSELVKLYIIPFDVKIMLVLFHLLGIQAKGDNKGIIMPASGHGSFSAQIIWSCIGWQSILLLLVTLITGLSGKYRLMSKLEAIAIGLMGTFWINIFRIMIVYLLGFYFGDFLAMIFHNVLGTFMIIGWLFFYWWFVYTFVLEE